MDCLYPLIIQGFEEQDLLSQIHFSKLNSARNLIFECLWVSLSFKILNIEASNMCYHSHFLDKKWRLW